jgi:hypothetical protein
MGMKNKIRKFLENIVAAALSKIEQNNLMRQQNILENLKVISYRETANYVLKSMWNAKAFNSNKELYDYIFANFKPDGEILEFGVYKGSTINYFSDRLFGRKIFGFDSFEGLPEQWRPGFEKGHFALNGNLPPVRENITLVKGWFEESIPYFLLNYGCERIGLLHIDCDLYSSTKTIFNLLGEKISSGTIIIFDEYFNYPGWSFGEFKAFQEFVSENNITYSYIGYNANHEQVALIIN